MTQRVGVGVIGTGFMGVAHVEAVRRLGLDVVGVVGSTPARARAKAAVRPLGPVVDNVAALLADPAVDVVHVTSPNHLHAEHARAAIAAGKHVVCEKPLGVSSEETADLLARAETAGVVHAVCFNLRHYPQNQHAAGTRRRGSDRRARGSSPVATTRAQEHLILSGATDLEKRHPASDLSEPMRWIWRGLCPGLPDDAAEGVHVDEREGREVRVRFTRLTPETLDELLPPADRAPVREQPTAEPGHQQPVLELGVLPAPRALPVSRLSYSGLEDYRRCGYRFYLQRALRLAPVDPPQPVGNGEPVSGMSPLLRGSLVHELLERLDFDRPAVPGETDVAGLLVGHGAIAAAEVVADLRDMVERVAGSRLRERIAAAQRVRTELPFAFTLTPRGAGGRSLLINGVVDVHAVEDDGVLVVDWKSDPLAERDPEEVVAGSYSTQRIVYALAVLRSGAERVEVAHCFLERPDELATATYTRADAERLERDLLELARGVVEASFAPTAEPHLGLCGDCPGRDALCSHGPEMTLRTEV